MWMPSAENDCDWETAHMMVKIQAVSNFCKENEEWWINYLKHEPEQGILSNAYNSFKVKRIQENRKVCQWI